MKLQTPILITGASGFIGANLLSRITKKVSPKEVHVFLRKNSNLWRINDLLEKVSAHIVNLQDQTGTEQLLQKIRPKTIFHLATHGAYPYQTKDEKEILETNIICTFNLLQACLKIGFEAFINSGTSSEYGVNQKPMRENDILIPVTAYGVTKAWATLYGQYLACSQKAPIKTLRLFGVYGFYEPRGRLIPNIILSLLKKERPNLIAPHFARDFVFVDDVVDAYFAAAERKNQGMIFNIGSGAKIKLEEVFCIIKKIMGVDIDPIWGDYTNNLSDENRRIADISFTKRNLKWQPKTDLRIGLEHTIEWFEKNISLYR